MTRAWIAVVALTFVACTSNVVNNYQLAPDAGQGGAPSALHEPTPEASTDAGTEAAGPCADGTEIMCGPPGCSQTCVGGQYMPCVCGGPTTGDAGGAGGSGATPGTGGTAGSPTVDAGNPCRLNELLKNGICVCELQGHYDTPCPVGFHCMTNGMCMCDNDATCTTGYAGTSTYAPGTCLATGLCQCGDYTCANGAHCAWINGKHACVP